MHRWEVASWLRAGWRQLLPHRPHPSPGRGFAAPAAGSQPEDVGHPVTAIQSAVFTLVARLLGGSLDAGPRPGGGFAVVDRLPLGGTPA